MRVLFIGCCVLAGCGVAQSVRDLGYEEVPDIAPIPERSAIPAAVVFEGDSVIVAMNDGAECLGSAGALLSPAGWTGRLSECAYPYRYAVELAAGTVAGRVFLEPASLDILVAEGEVPFRPFVTVLITDAAGQRYRFQTADGF